MIRTIDIIDLSKLSDCEDSDVIGHIKYTEDCEVQVYLYSDYFNQNIEIKLWTLTPDWQDKINEMIRDDKDRVLQTLTNGSY